MKSIKVQIEEFTLIFAKAKNRFQYKKKFFTYFQDSNKRNKIHSLQALFVKV